MSESAEADALESSGCLRSGRRRRCIRSLCHDPRIWRIALAQRERVGAGVLRVLEQGAGVVTASATAAAAANLRFLNVVLNLDELINEPPPR